jgi:hypothetical protein
MAQPIDKTDTKVPEGARTVTVACRHPAGLVLQLCAETSYMDPHTNREVKQYLKTGEQIKLNGFAVSRGADFNPETVQPLAGGFGLTHGVPGDFFREWMRQNKDSDIVRNGLVFCHEKSEDVVAKAKERAKDVTSGLEPLRPDKDPRSPRGIKKAETKDMELA